MADRFATHPEGHPGGGAGRQRGQRRAVRGRGLYRGRKGQDRHPDPLGRQKGGGSTFNIENLTDADNITIQHHINQAIKAHGVMTAGYRLRGQGRRGHHRGRVHRPSDVSAAGTTRACTRPSRPRKASRWSGRSKTLATITFQNYFRLYKKLSGMTGTAMTEEDRVPSRSTSWTWSRSPPTSP